MNRLAMLVLLFVLATGLVACGRGADEATIPTPVAVYTRSTDNADSSTQPATTEASDSETGAGVEATAEGAAPEGPVATAAAIPTETDGSSDEIASNGANVPEEAEPTATATESEPAPASTATPIPTAAPTLTPTPESAADVAVAATDTSPAAESEQMEVADSQADGAEEFAGVPGEIAALIPSADIERGGQLTLQNACIGCHNLDPNVPMAGPTWHNMAETAATRVAGQGAAAYLYNSIIHPNDHIVDGYAAGVMLQTYETTLSPQDLADIIGYLLTLRGE